MLDENGMIYAIVLLECDISDGHLWLNKLDIHIIRIVFRVIISYHQVKF